MIGDLVDTNSLSLDIGCDHALLDIYLIKERGMKKVIASDRLEAPLKGAFQNIKREKVEDQVELRLGDGLSVYTDDISTVVMSGLGGRTMIGIFKYQPTIMKKIKEIIVSPNNYQSDVRSFFCRNGFYLSDEVFIKEGKIIYQIMKFQRGRKRYTKKDAFFGPILRKKKDHLFYEFYGKEQKSREILLELLPKNYHLKRWKMKKEIRMIEKELSDCS